MFKFVWIVCPLFLTALRVVRLRSYWQVDDLLSFRLVLTGRIIVECKLVNRSTDDIFIKRLYDDVRDSSYDAIKETPRSS